MLTIKQITDNTEGVIRGLEKSTSKMQKQPLNKCLHLMIKDVIHRIN